MNLHSLVLLLPIGKKKATTSFKEHECSRAHRYAVAFELSTNLTPATKLHRSEVNTIHVSQKGGLRNPLFALQYLLGQSISIRNDNAGGLILTVILQSVLGQLTWVDNHKYQSPEIIYEMIQLIVFYVH